MADLRRDSAHAHSTVRLVSGGAQYDFSASSSVQVGDIIAAYLGDHEICRSSVYYDQSEHCIIGIIDLRHIPSAEFPITIRAMVDREGVSLPDLLIRTKDQIFKHIPLSSSKSRFLDFNANSICCEINISSLPLFTRKFILRINNVNTAIAISIIDSQKSKPNEAVHVVTFKLDTKVMDGDVIEVFDESSEKRVLELEVGWENITNIISHCCAELTGDIKKIKDEMQNLAICVAELSSRNSEKFALERIDLYHAIMNAKIDRVIKAHVFTSLENETEHKHEDSGADLDVISKIEARSLEGVGLYNVESNGESTWRWVGPRSTFAFKNIPNAARTFIFNFSSLIGGENKYTAKIIVNGLQIPANLINNSGVWELQVFIPDQVRRSDQILLIHLEFSHFQQPDGDHRILSAALQHVEITY